MKQVQRFNALISQYRFALKSKDRLYSACVCSAMLNGKATYQLKSNM